MFYVYRDDSGELHFFVERQEDAVLGIFQLEFVGVATLSIADPSEPEPL